MLNNYQLNIKKVLIKYNKFIKIILKKVFKSLPNNKILIKKIMKMIIK